MITARMINNKYIELAPDYPYEVVEYKTGKIKLKDNPRCYPISAFKIQKDGMGENLNTKEIEDVMQIKRVKDFLECVGISAVFIMAGVAAFLIFATVYFYCELVFVSWFNEEFMTWFMNEIRIICLHPENFCFVIGMSVILGVPVILAGVILVRLIIKYVKRIFVR